MLHEGDADMKGVKKPAYQRVFRIELERVLWKAWLSKPCFFRREGKHPPILDRQVSKRHLLLIIGEVRLIERQPEHLSETELGRLLQRKI
ncbi:hypothetical protein [Aromatoleum aromaticum]|uniref:hypothetical protein n=1 Tax=Aromatoleum aromaticum TaxID=551760 RepID=UPI0012FF02EE|nr:hypothetical protein [Aromatoleum aromaticum]